MKGTVYEKNRKIKKGINIPWIKTVFAQKAVYVMMQAAAGILSLLMARATVFKFCNPFALALCSAVPIEFLPVSTVGSAAGYLISGYEIIPLRYICALIIIILLRRVLAASKLKESPFSSGICGTAASAVTGIAASLITDEVNTTLLIYILESLLIGAGSVFWNQGIKNIGHIRKFNRLNTADITCILFSIYLVLLSLSYINIYSASPARILSVMLCLICAYYGKVSGGAVAGISAGISMSLGSDNPYFCSCYALGGLLAGIGFGYRKLAACTGMLVSCALHMLITSGNEIGFIPAAETAAGCILFLMIPENFLNRFSFVNKESGSVSLEGINTHAASRLRFASSALGYVSSSVKSIHNKIEDIKEPKKLTVYKNTMVKTCENCGLKYYCWEQQKNYTASVFKKIESRLEEEKGLTKDMLPNDFGKRCIRSAELIENFTESYRNFVTSSLTDKKMDDIRSVMAVQYDAISKMLYDLSYDIESKEIPDSQLTSILQEILEYYDVKYDAATVVADASSHIKISVSVCGETKRFTDKNMIKDIEDACRRNFAPADITETESGAIVNIHETPALRADFGFCQINAENGIYCGDAFENFTDSNGRSVIVLSDGMGKGGFAHIDSMLASSVMKKLLSSGFSAGSAIKVVNSALMVKSADESFATIDMAAIDLFSGKTVFYKAGATCSFIRKKEKCGRVELSSLPVGILREADFASTGIKLGAGDIIVMVSDGVTQGNCRWINDRIENFDSGTANDLARLIASEASSHQYGSHEDDITVLVSILHNI